MRYKPLSLVLVLPLKDTTLRETNHFCERDPFLLLLTLFNAKEMAELNSTEHASAELITPEARVQELAEDPEATSAPWETESAPSLPSIDSQHNNVSLRACLGCFDSDLGL